MRKWLPWLLVAGTVVALDQWSKRWILQFMADAPLRFVNDWFDLVLAHNQGAAFSFLAGAGGWQRGFFSAVAVLAIGFMFWLIGRHLEEPRFCLGLSLISGGAAGNLIDRIRWGTVTDFIQWHVGTHYWPAFNTADSAITLGVAILLWDSWRNRF